MRAERQENGRMAGCGDWMKSYNVHFTWLSAGSKQTVGAKGRTNDGNLSARD